MNSEPLDIAANLASVRAKIRSAADAAERRAADVTLVAVSKTQPVERIEAAIGAGQQVFGENRIQEAQKKWPDLRQRHPQVSLRLIGQLQTNKAREAVALFDVIETVDRPKLAKILAAEMTKSGRRPDCLVQVNTGEEEQKSGTIPTEADAFIRYCRDDLALPIVGTMCIPPIDQDPAPHFALLHKIADRNGLPVVSMGMSADYDIAIRFGATHVRVGTAIFGPRQVAP